MIAEKYTEESIKAVFFDLLQWVSVNRYDWLEEFKQKMEDLSDDERFNVQWHDFQERTPKTFDYTDDLSDESLDQISRDFSKKQKKDGK